MRLPTIHAEFEKLAREAAGCGDADYIVFCGVHFMAESADVLSASHQQVILPDLAAGCSMADMAAADQLELCWDELAALGVNDLVPVTYINSAASIKSFCGERGGVVCTSSNAEATLRWAWERGEKILFLPDQHLGRNTAYKMGVPLDEMVVWDPEVAYGDISLKNLVLSTGKGTVRFIRSLRFLKSSTCVINTQMHVSLCTLSAPGMSYRLPMKVVPPSILLSRLLIAKSVRRGPLGPSYTW